jgi:formiminoglutamate deiminase
MSMLIDYWSSHVWLGGDRLVPAYFQVDSDNKIANLTERSTPPLGVHELNGMVLPGLANAHSHAFHRALRGRTHNGTGSFWTWRDQMYAAAARLDPELYLELATATFAEMVLSGYTVVGEFHYLHHARGGVGYANPNEMGDVLVEAAKRAGIRITVLDSAYLRGGFGVELNEVQQRFSDGSARSWIRRNEQPRASTSTARYGAAIHSVRALSFDDIRQVARWTNEAGLPLHAHVSEQPAENELCIGNTGRTPVQLLHDARAITSGFCAVHATHLTDDDIALLGTAHATACFCPTTERDLADGIGPSRALRDAGALLAIGSDSHAVIDPFEELRAIEMHQRLVTNERGNHRVGELLVAGSAAGYRSLGWNGGAIADGMAADFIVIDPSSIRLAGADLSSAASVVYGATSADVSDVFVDGVWVVQDRKHIRVDVSDALRTSIDNVWSAR